MVDRVAAIDVGYGNTKWRGGEWLGRRQWGIFPSLSEWSVGAPQDRLAERMDVVHIPFKHSAGKRIVHTVGPDIQMVLRRNRSALLSDSYQSTEEYHALMRAALRYLDTDHLEVLMLGLPVKQWASGKGALMSGWTGKIETTDGRYVQIDKVRVLAQPQGALAWYAETTGNQSVTKRDRNLVVDVGMRTFDWLLSDGMHLLEGHSSSVNCGMADILQAVAKGISDEISRPYDNLDALDRALRSRSPLVLDQRRIDLREYGFVLDKVASEAVGRMQEALHDAAAIRHIVVVGGGAFAFRKAIAKAFPNHKIQDLREPELANVKGFYAAGCAFARRVRPEAPSSEAA